MVLTLLCSLGFLPLSAQAGFLGGLLGKEVLANSNSLSISDQNSQNMNILEPNMSALSVVDNDKKSEISSDVEVSILSDTALLPVTGPLGVPDGEEVADFSSLDQLSIYVVHKGDTFSSIADMYGVTVDTILSANDYAKGDKPKEGDVLLILPFSAVEHTVTKGQTLQGIANLYKISIDDIISANDIGEGAKIAIGEKLIIPGGSIINETKAKTSGSPALAKGSGASSMPNVVGYFINPVPGAIKSRGVKPGHKGVDLAAPIGTPIRASASGIVLKAAMGWNGAFGNMVIIQHPNGVQTLYAHMSRLGTSTGARVSQGDIIGYVGSTGRSTGPHLHFEVRGARNPF